MKKLTLETQKRDIIRQNEYLTSFHKALSFNFVNESLSNTAYSQKKLSVLNKKTRITKIRNICLLTGRKRSTYSMFRLSRLQIRKWAQVGSLPGLRKSS